MNSRTQCRYCGAPSSGTSESWPFPTIRPPAPGSLWGLLGATLMGSYLGRQGMNPSASGTCAHCAGKRTQEELVPSSETDLMKELQDLRARHEELARTVKDLQAKTEITEFMHEWARLADKIEVEKRDKDLDTLVDQMMTPTGTCDFPANWMGVWGPDKQDIKSKFRNFAADIQWAYHVYPNAVIRLNWSEGAEGTADYSTVAELVPIRIKKEHKILCLQQDSLLWRVKGQWKMHRYKLSNLVEVPLPPPER